MPTLSFWGKEVSHSAAWVRAGTPWSRSRVKSSLQPSTVPPAATPAALPLLPAPCQAVPREAALSSSFLGHEYADGALCSERFCRKLSSARFPCSLGVLHASQNLAPLREMRLLLSTPLLSHPQHCSRQQGRPGLHPKRPRPTPCLVLLPRAGTRIHPSTAELSSSLHHRLPPSPLIPLR